MKTILLSSLFVLTGLIFSPIAAAQNGCTPLFNGGQTCIQHADFSINKTIKEPGTNAYRENLTATSNYFAPDQILNFRITVKNTSNNTIENVTVTDTLPGYTSYISGDGKFDFNTKLFTAMIAKLDKGQSKNIAFNVKVLPMQQIPGSPTPLCITNQATAAQGNRFSADNATFCIANSVLGAATENTTANGATTKGGLPVFGQTNAAKSPNTGPEMLGVIGLPVLAAIGHLLRKSTNQ